MAAETFAQSLWSNLSPQGPKIEPLRGDMTIDVLVVGAGFLGLSTALHLAESGLGVALVEAREVGFGASGRNTGFVVPSLRAGAVPADFETRLGRDHAARLAHMVAQSGETLFALVRRLGLSCAAEQTGWLQPAHTVAAASRLEGSIAERREMGSRVEMPRRRGDGTAHRNLGLSRRSVRSHGWTDQSACLRARSCRSRDRGRCQALRRDCGSCDQRRKPAAGVARTPEGSIRADRILLTTNALVGRLMPDLADSIVPTRVYQIATNVLPADVQARILPSRASLSDTRRHTFALRWSPDGRLVTGGLVLPGPWGRERAARTFTRRLQRFYPDLAQRIKADFVWNGVIAATMDALPRYLTLAPGLDAAIGCNGRGVALTTSLGREIACLYAGQVSLKDFVLPHLRPHPVPGRRLAEIGPHFWLPWSNFRDHLETRQ